MSTIMWTNGMMLIVYVLFLVCLLADVERD